MKKSENNSKKQGPSMFLGPVRNLSFYNSAYNFSMSFGNVAFEI
jgi:hypothetical protein